MKRKTNQKNLIITILIVLLLALAVGYAALSDVLTISGTANAKGTFDLEFQNAEIVKNVGADSNKTTAVISEDRNTLTVNVTDLSYPGSGVEFSVDIVNVGTIPAEVQAVTPTNITGSDKIKVTGLDVIKTNHPKIEAGDKCNIHFTVEWPVDSGEILENESSISFGLQIEYVQSTGELFEGNTLHIDTDKNGNTVNINTIGGEEIPTEPEKKTLASQITPQDYGKSINYKAIVAGGVEVNNWRVLYNDGSSIHIILDDFLPVELLPRKVFNTLNILEPYSVYSDSTSTLLDSLKEFTNWNEFANGICGFSAQGAPEFDILIKSYNEKHNTSLDEDFMNGLDREIDNTDTLYVPHKNIYNETHGYWIEESFIGLGNNNNLWCVDYNGYVQGAYYGSSNFAARPVVILVSSATGTVGETIEIDGI